MFLIIIAVFIIAVMLVSMFYFNDFDSVSMFMFPVGLMVVGLITSSYTVPSGTVAVDKGFGGNYTGKVVTTPGLHVLAKPVSHHMEKVDIRNDKTSVKVDVMKDKAYNVHAKMEVIYDLEPKKIVDLLKNNPHYKSTVIGATVKEVVTENNSLANSQTLNDKEKKLIKDKLESYGIQVTNIYMDSYQLTNSNNFAINQNDGSKGDD